ncbi:serine-rich adhesin for platelets-like isoform X2 [Heterodontus francisci]
MNQQFQVRLKAAAVPHVERKIYVYRDFGKQMHSKVLGQDLETKTISMGEHEKILGTEDLSNSELQKSTIDEEGVKNYNHLAIKYGNDNKTNILLNTSELSENAGGQSLPVGCNIENVKHTLLSSNVHAIQQKGNDCAVVETGHSKTDNAISNSASGLQSSIIEPKDMCQNYPMDCTNDILITHTDGYLSNSKHENIRASLLNLLSKSRSLPVVAKSNKNRQQSYSSNNICVPSQRDKGYSQNNSESSSLSSVTGTRSLNVCNKGVLQQDLSDCSLNSSQKGDSAFFLKGRKLKSIPTVSSPVPVHTPHSPLLSTYTDSKWNTNTQNCDNATSQRGSINESLQISQHKLNRSLSLSEPVSQPRATLFITISNKNKQQYSKSDNMNIGTHSKCNDSCRDGKERTPLFTEKFSVVPIALSETRTEPATVRDADGPLPESENNNWKHNCEDKGRSMSLLPTKLIGSQLPTCVTTCMDSNVLQTCAPNRTNAALQSGGNGYLQKVKHGMSHELSADPKTAPQCVTNVIYYKSAIQSNHPKNDDVTLENMNNDSLQNDESETSSATGMTITQSPNYTYKAFASQSPSLTSNDLHLDRNSNQNSKQASVITLSTDQCLSYKFPVPYSYKYHLLGHLAKSTDITADRTGNEHKSDPNCVLPLRDSTKAPPSETKNSMKNTLQNYPSHTINSNLPKIPCVDNIQNYKSEMTSAPSSVVVMQHLSINTNKGKSSKNHSNSGNNNNVQKNTSETVNDEQSSTTITHMHHNTSLTYSSLRGGNEYLPKDKSETNSKLSAQDLLRGQESPTNFNDSNQDKSLANFPLGDNTTMVPGTIKNAENYQSEKNIPISSQDTLTGQQSPTNTHSNVDKLLIHSPVRSGIIKNLENDQPENYRVVSLPGTTIDSKTPSDIIHGTKSTLQNWERNNAGITMIRGITKDYKQVDTSKMDITLSVLDPVSNQLSLIDNTHCNEQKPVSHSPNRADITGNRKSHGSLQNCNSEISTAIVSKKVTHQLPPMNIMYNKDKRLNYFPNSIDKKREVKDLTEQEKSETTYAPSSLDPVTSQPSPVNITHKNRYESLNCSFNNSAFTVDTGFNKYLQKDNPEISLGPSTDSLNNAYKKQYLQKDKPDCNSTDPSPDLLVVEESPTVIADKRKNGLPHYSGSVSDIYCDEEPCDRFKSEFLGNTNSAFSSPPNTIHNHQNKPLIHPLLSNDIYVVREGNQFLQKNKSESHTVDPSSEILTGLQSVTMNTDIKKGALQNYSSEVTEIAHDKKSCDTFTFKKLHETNSAHLPPPPVTSQCLPTILSHNNKSHSRPHSPLSGDAMLDMGDNARLQKDNRELSTPDSLTDQQSPTNITHDNINKSLTHSPFIDDISMGPRGVKNLENYQSENHGAISPGGVTGQRTPTNFTQGGKNTLQNLSLNNDDNALGGRFNKDNEQQDRSETTYISPALDSVIARQFSTNILHRSKYESLIYSPDSPVVIADGGSNVYLQKDNTGPTLPDSLTDQQSPANIHNKVKSVTHFPLSDDTALGAGVTKNAKNYQSEKSNPFLSQNKLTGQQSLTNKHSNIDKPLTHSSESGDIEVKENLQKCEPKSSSVTSPVYPFTPHSSAASITDVKKNTLQHYITKVTDIYHRKRPSGRFKLNALLKTKGASSTSSAMTSQWLPENISGSRNQDKSKTLSLLRNDISLLAGIENAEKYQSEESNMVSSADKLNEQWNNTNITQGRKNTLQNCPPNIDSITVDREVKNICDERDKCETKCMPSAPKPVSSQLSSTNIGRRNEHKPLSHFLNSATVNVHRERPDYLEKCKYETKSALLSGDKVTQQKSSTSMTHSHKDKPLNHSAVTTDVNASNRINQDYNQDKFKTNCIHPAQDPVTSQQPSKNITHSDKCKTLLNSATVTADTGVNENLQKDTPETNKIPAGDSLTGLQPTTTIRGIEEGAFQNDSSKAIAIAHDKKSFDILNFKLLHETNSVQLSPPPVNCQWFPTDVTHNNKSHSRLHSKLSGVAMLDMGDNECLQKDNSELSTPDSLTDQQSPTNITHDNINKSLTHSPFIDDTTVGPRGVKKSVNHGSISPCGVTGQRTPTDITQGGKNTLQNLPLNNDDITLDRRFNKDNERQDKSETTYISSASDSVIGRQFSTNIPHRSKYESLIYSPDSPVVIADGGSNVYLQKDNTGLALPDSLTDQQSPTNIHNKVKSVTHFPLSDDTALGAGVTKNAKNYQSEKSNPILSQNKLTGQQSLTNKHSNIDKPLTHSSESGDIEVKENLQKCEPKGSSVTSPVYPFTPHSSAASITDVKKNILQHYITKVTDIYHRKRPSGRFKLNALLKTKGAPSTSSAVTSQWLPENISDSSNQDKSKTLSLLRNDISLLAGIENAEKYQSEESNMVSSADKLNEQWNNPNITQGRKNTLQNCPPNIDSITVDREVKNICDARDKCETKCMPSAPKPVSSQLSPTNIGRRNEHKPLSHFLNSAAVNVHRERPDYLEKCKYETKSALLSGDKVTQQKSSTSMTHSHKDKPLNHSAVTTDVNASNRINQDYNQDKFKTSCIHPAQDPVTSQQPSKNITHSDKCKTFLNSATVTADTEVNENLQKDTPETNKIPAGDSKTDIQSTTTITEFRKNTRQNYSSKVTEIYHDKIPYKRLNLKVLHKTNSAPSSPPKAQWLTTNIIHNNQDKPSTHSTLSGEFIMTRGNNLCIQRNKSENINEFSLLSSLAGQQLPSNIIKSKQAMSQAHSPNRGDFVMDTADIKNLQNCQTEKNRGALFQTPNDQFQNWFPNNEMSLSRRRGVNMKHYKSKTDIALSLPDLLIDEESLIDVTCSKKSRYLRESSKSSDITLDREYNDNCEQINKRLISSISSSPDSAPALLSPTSIIHNNRNVIWDHSSNSANFPSQDYDIAKEDDKLFRNRRKPFCEEMFQNRTLGTWMKNTNVSNSLQQSSPEENQIDSGITDINNFRNRLNAYSDFSRYRASSSSIDEDSTVNNNYPTGTARFSKDYSRFTSSLMPNPQNIQSRYGTIYKAKSLKDIISNCNQSSFQDHENVFSTNSYHNSKLTVRNRQVNPIHQFSNRIKSSRLYRSYSDLPFSNGNESDYDNWTSDHGSKFNPANRELVNRNDNTRNVSKEEKKKETHLENMKNVLVVDRLWKPGYLHKKASSPRSEDVFNRLTSGVNQDPGVNEVTVQNDEYFPVDIKIFWPKENPTDILRLLSSSSTGSKISEDSLSPQQHHTPAVTDKRNLSCYSDTNSDTTTDDEYLLDGNEIVKESAL